MEESQKITTNNYWAPLLLLQEETSVDEAIETFMEVSGVVIAASKVEARPARRAGSKHASFVSKKTLRVIRRRRALSVLCRSSPTAVNKRLLAACQQAVKAAIKTDRKQGESRRLALGLNLRASKNQKQYWGVVKSFTSSQTSHTSVSPVKSLEGKLMIELHEVISAWTSHYSVIGQPKSSGKD